MPLLAYIGKRGKVQSGGDVYGSVDDSMILCVITLISSEC